MSWPIIPGRQPNCNLWRAWGHARPRRLLRLCRSENMSHPALLCGRTSAFLAIVCSGILELSCQQAVGCFCPRLHVASASLTREFNRISIGVILGRNCGGFLRISTIARGMSNADVDPMDSMRIHPRHYKDAVRMAQAAQGDTPPEQADEAEEHLTVNKALQHPEKIEALDLEVRC